MEENASNTTGPYATPQSNINMGDQSDFGAITPLFASAGWLKFLGVLAIIIGAFYAISLVGLVVAWLPIWIGVLLLQAGGKLNANNSAAEVYEAADKLRLVIKIFGIAMIVNLAFFAIAMVFWASMIGAMIAGGMH